MKEGKKVGTLLGLGIFLMPYIFLWPLLRGDYRTRDKLFGVLWLTTLIAAVVVGSAQSPHTQSEPSPVVQTHERGLKDGLISYQSRWEPIYKKFSGKWAQDKNAASDFSFEFKNNEAYAHFLIKRDGLPQEIVLPVMDDDCKEKETGYGLIGDSDQKIGLELVQYQRGAYFYQAVCHDYGSASGHIFVKDSMKALTAYTCREKECRNSTSYIDVSEERHYVEEERVAPSYEDEPPAAPASDPLVESQPAD